MQKQIKQKYLAFISSTFKDLKSERSQIALDLLGVNCIPAGMEYFGAQAKKSWDIINQTIDESDFYILIVKNMYGSIDEESKDRLSYTEMEYNYAKARGKEIFAFIYTGNIINREDKEDKEKEEKLKLFIERIKKSRYNIAYWRNEDSLKTNILKAVSIWKDDNEGLDKGWMSLKNTEADKLIINILENKVTKLSSTDNKELYRVVSKNTRELLAQIDGLKNKQISVPTHVLYEQINNAIKDPEYNEYYIIDNALFRWNELLELEDKIGYNTFNYTSDILQSTLERVEDDEDFSLKRLFLIYNKTYKRADHKDNFDKILSTFANKVRGIPDRYENRLYIVNKEEWQDIGSLGASIKYLKEKVKDVFMVKIRDRYIVFQEEVDFTLQKDNLNAIHTKSKIFIKEENDDWVKKTMKHFGKIFNESAGVGHYVKKHITN